MRCNECKNQLLMEPPGNFAPLSQSKDVADHLKNCESCAQFAQQQQRIAEGLRHIAGNINGPALSEKTERTLAAAFQSSVTNRRLGRQSGWLGSGPRFALAFTSALCVLAFILAGVHRDGRRTAQVKEPRQTESEQFVVVPYVVQPAPWERTEVVRIDVSLSALRALGFQVHTAETGGSVTADVLCGQDGRVLAVALLPDSRTTSGERVQE